MTITKTLFLVMLLTLTLSPLSTPAQSKPLDKTIVLSYENGSSLQQACADMDITKSSADDVVKVSEDKGLCAGFIEASIAAIDTKFWNPPDDVHGLNLQQAIAVVRKYLAAHPELWTWDASALVKNAIIEAFPPLGAN